MAPALLSWGETPLWPLPAHVHESYRLQITSGWSGDCVLRAECRHNDDLDAFGFPLAAGVLSKSGLSITFRESHGGTITLERWRYRLTRKRIGANKKIVSEEWELSSVEWATFAMLLESAQFWQLPENDGKCGFDGADWTLEGAKQECFQGKVCLPQTGISLETVRLIAEWVTGPSGPAARSLHLHLIDYNLCRQYSLLL